MTSCPGVVCLSARDDLMPLDVIIIIYLLYFDIRLILYIFLFSVDGSCLQNTPCNKCGRGARCVFGNYCTAFCITATIVHEERFRKYCPRIGQPNPFLHQFGKRSVSRSERSADPDMMEIEYKVPFLDMLDDILDTGVVRQNLA